MRSLPQRIIDLWIAWRLPLLLLAVVLATVSYFPGRRLEFDRSIESMFAPQDSLMGPYQRLKRIFGGNEIVLAVYQDEELFHPDGRGIRRVAEVSRKLKAVEGVDDVLSIDQPLGTAIVEADNSAAGRARKLFEGYTHSADGKIAAVVCLLAPQSRTKIPRQEVIARMRRIVETLPPPLAPGMLAGEPVMLVDGFRYVEEDGVRLGFTSTVLLAAVIILCFRSLRWVIVSVAVVQLAIVSTRATLVWSGLQLSMVSSMLTAVVTVVGIATVVHVIVRFREARLSGLSPRDALSQAGRLLAAPIFWSCATTAAGFASLMVAKVGPVQDFGLMMAIGALLVLASVALVLPGLALLGRFDRAPQRAWGEKLLEGPLSRIIDLLRRRPKTLALATLLVVAAAASGLFRLQVESDFTKNFRATSPIVRSYDFVETHLGGAGVWDVILPSPENRNWEYLHRVRQLEDRLRREVVVEDTQGSPATRLTKVLSMADGVLAAAPKDPDRMSRGLRRNLMVRVAWRHFANKMPVLKRALVGEDPRQPDRHFVRIMLRARERQPSARKRAMIAQVERISRQEFPPQGDSPGAEVTGFFVLLANLIESIIRDQWFTFGVAAAAIGLMMVVALRSPVLAAVALVPNALPILVVTGLMGWLGLKINMGAAMIAAVSIGLSIDSSIHYITAFRRARDEGIPLGEALDAVQQTVGRAVVFSTLALIVGFSVLCTSQFVPTIYFGALVSLTMLGGLAGNLVVLPLLLTLVTRESTPARTRSASSAAGE